MPPTKVTTLLATDGKHWAWEHCRVKCGSWYNSQQVNTEERVALLPLEVFVHATLHVDSAVRQKTQKLCPVHSCHAFETAKPAAVTHHMLIRNTTRIALELEVMQRHGDATRCILA